MIAKLGNFSELSKLVSVKSRIGDDIFALFGMFQLSQTLRRLGLEKQCGHSASELIQSLCLFKVLGETIGSMWHHKFYDLLQVGKNCFYRMLTRSSMDWRRLLAAMVIHFLAILRSRKVDFYKGVTCFILDDTTAEKTTKKAERVSRVFDHVVCKCVLGYKVQILCVSDGVTTIPVDFSIHREKGEKGDYGLTQKERRKQFHKKREAVSPAVKRLKEADGNKLDIALEMIARAWKLRIRPQYVLADSWYLSEKLLRGVLQIGKGALDFLGMAKMGSTKYKVEGRLLDAASLIAKYERTRHHECRKYHCWYITLNGEYSKTGIPVRIFLVKCGHNRTWNILVTTDMEMGFVKAFETYQMRWGIEVLIKDCRQNLGFCRCLSNDFDAQVADVTITFLTYIVAALDLRFSEYETMGQLFDSMEEELTRLTLWNTILDCIEKILGNLLERCGINLDDVIADILRDSEAAKEIVYMAKAMTEYRKAG
jgi:hypothetical protein